MEALIILLHPLSKLTFVFASDANMVRIFAFVVANLVSRAHVIQSGQPSLKIIPFNNQLIPGVCIGELGVLAFCSLAVSLQHLIYRA